MTRIDPSSLMAMRSAILQQNSALQKAASAPIAAPVQPAGVGQADFTKALSSALGDVNAAQAKAASAADAYERGESTDIAAVMLSREQASVGFQATLQVRNKLLAAYKDIMSMPV
ncbi:MAG: flagellar hook-basal body complex subunit FliE [Sphingomonas bacterium]|jgi:flagellar hook-basal body complex protein FliE|nr:flagellar hook-basal body complex protein FliE [Sphingomonas bacterium]MDB5689653.1 flagellar hook-basal body complex subunit FliE [Sphingomonas bacterium]